MISLRQIAIVYLPTVGLWSAVQAVKFYRQTAGELKVAVEQS